jgi:hypothetical protein
VCSSARSVIYTGQHIQHTGVFDNMEAPWARNMSTEKGHDPCLGLRDELGRMVRRSVSRPDFLSPPALVRACADRADCALVFR